MAPLQRIKIGEVLRWSLPCTRFQGVTNPVWRRLKTKKQATWYRWALDLLQLQIQQSFLLHRLWRVAVLAQVSSTCQAKQPLDLPPSCAAGVEFTVRQLRIDPLLLSPPQRLQIRSATRLWCEASWTRCKQARQCCNILGHAEKLFFQST